MRESAIDVLVYLFENYINENAIWDMVLEDEAFDLSVELTAAGFDKDAVETALDWLEHLPQTDPNETVVAPCSADAMRIYSHEEQAALGAQGLNFLMEMERVGLINMLQREAVIERVLALDIESIDLDHFKWLVCLVLFNTAADGNEEELRQIENLEDWIYSAEVSVAH